jgi:hypothetical protein
MKPVLASNGIYGGNYQPQQHELHLSINISIAAFVSIKEKKDEPSC